MTDSEDSKKKKEGSKSFYEFIDPALLELFCTEMVNHVVTLNHGLVTLEADPTSFKDVKALQDACHQIKGAARIVHFNIIVEVAQALEDCFLTVDKQKHYFSHSEIDILLQAVDFLSLITEVSRDDLSEWLEDHRSHSKKLLDQIAAMNLDPSESVESQSEIPKEEEIPSEEKADKELIFDTSMLDLFRVEVETRIVVLNNGLIAQENNGGDDEQLEELMRAAHSIKGAARVIGLTPIVQLAHAMEDCFVAAQEKRIVFDSTQIDNLLIGVDLFSRLINVESDNIQPWLLENEKTFSRLLEEYSKILRGKSVSAEDSQATASVSNPPSKKEEPKKKEVAESVSSSSHDRVLRVTAQSLNSLMGLAGESLVESRWLEPFGDSLLQLKRSYNEIALILDRLRDAIDADEGKDKIELHLMEARKKNSELRDVMAIRVHELDMFIRQHSHLSDRLYREVIASRMRPFSDGTVGFPRMVRDMARQLGKKIKLEITGLSTSVDRDIMEKLEAPLNHLIRNAIDHGIESPGEREIAGKDPQGTIKIESRHCAGMLSITVSDDGRGVDLEQLREKVIKQQLTSKNLAENLSDAELLEFLFLPGFSTASKVTDLSGRGVGLDVAMSMVQEVGGIMRSSVGEGKGLTVNMQLPLTLSVIRALLVEISGEPYAFPLGRIDCAVMVSIDDVLVVENRQFFTLNGKNTGLILGHQVLDLEKHLPFGDQFSVVIVSDHINFYGVVVDRFIGERELVVQEIDRRLGKVENISSGAFMEDGEPILIIDVEDMVKSIDAILHGRRLYKVGLAEQAAKRKMKKVLVIDDSITVREVECRLLRNQGYYVDSAVDGMDGWNALQGGSYDLVITDIDMPRMNGIELVKTIKQDERLKDLPVVVVSYKDREEDRMAGMEAGANYYLTKSSFHDEKLLEVVVDLIGEPDLFAK